MLACLWGDLKTSEFPEFPRVSRLGQYSAIQITGAGYKDLVHRQLYQDLIGRGLLASDIQQSNLQKKMPCKP